MELKFSAGFQQRVKGKFGKYEFAVGVLQDGPHKEPKPNLNGKPQLSSFAGGPTRKKSTRNSALTIADVSERNRQNLGFNYLTKPFEKTGSDIIRFTREFFRLAFGKSEKKRAENLLQAVVRNPILRGDYGTNSKVTQKIKGFDRYMIDTGQLFKAIKAVVRVRGRGV